METATLLLGFVGPQPMIRQPDPVEYRYDPDPKDPHRVTRIGSDGSKVQGRWVGQEFVPRTLK